MYSYLFSKIYSFGLDCLLFKMNTDTKTNTKLRSNGNRYILKSNSSIEKIKRHDLLGLKHTIKLAETCLN